MELLYYEWLLLFVVGRGNGSGSTSRSILLLIMIINKTSPLFSVEVCCFVVLRVFCCCF